MKSKTYKYNIHYYLRQLSYEDYEIAMKWLPEKLCISQSTWRRWIYVKPEESTEISFSNLQLLATFFEVEVRDLVNGQGQKNLKESFTKIKDDV